MGKILRVFCAIALAVLLTACGGVGGGPGRQLVERAIAIQLSQTQQQLSKQLRLNTQPSSITINRVSIAEKTPLEIGDLQAYRVKGTYDYTIKLPTHRVTQRENPFEVYLQRQKEGKTWRLAKQQISEGGEPTWVTQRITF
jgi:hypothetical protein